MQTLEARVAAGPLSIDEVGPIMADLIEAVAEIHSFGMSDRDLHAKRVVLESGRVRLLDPEPLPRTRRAEADPSAFDATLYRFDFMAPEQVRGSARTDGRADIYALGVLVFYALTQKRPFVAQNALARIALKLEHPAPTLESAAGRPFPPLLEAFVARALARDREERYPSIGVAREAWRLALS